MKISGLYNSKAEPYLDEIVFLYENVEQKLSEFMSYAEGAVSKGKRIVLRFDEEPTPDSFPRIKRIFKAFSANLLFETYPENDAFFLDFLKENRIPFFYSIPVDTFEKLLSFIADGVAAAVVSNALAFNINEVSKIAKASNIELRAFANIPQSREKIKPIETTFFIRPEDSNSYANYLDVISLLYNDSLAAVVTKAYHNDKKWFGDLAEIFVDLPHDTGLDGRYIIDTFCSKRLSCGRACLLEGAHCHRCTEIVELAKTLKEKGLYVNPTRKSHN